MGRLGRRLWVIRTNSRAGAVLRQAGLGLIHYSLKLADWVP